MTAATFTPGPVIAIEGGKRPWFVRDEDRLQWIDPARSWGFWRLGEHSSANRHGSDWPFITHIRLDAAHPESLRRTWNDAHPNQKPFDRVWMGRDRQPEDANGDAVLLRDGRVLPYISGWRWFHVGHGGDIIAYRSKPAAETVTPAQDDGTVRIARKTEAEWMATIRREPDGIFREPAFAEFLRSLDLIAPEPTTVDRFMAAHPDAHRETAELALKFGEAGR